MVENKDESMEELVYRTLKAAILQRLIAPGTQLVELTISDKLHTSRTPVRNAIKRLAADGIINIVPNPYYAYSAYESNQFANTIKITNLPERAIVTIYSLDGKFIRKFNREERPSNKAGSNPANGQSQINASIEWDMKNAVGIPVSSGVYLIHVLAPELGEERTIKWFGVNRKFDPTGL